jgi:hypothetical protein
MGEPGKEQARTQYLGRHAMHAEVGDRLVLDGDPARVGLIIDVPHPDGSPPYVIKWLTTGHIALVSPDQFGRVVHTRHLTCRPVASLPPGGSVGLL